MSSTLSAKNALPRTDLAMELIGGIKKPKTDSPVKKCEVTVDAALSKKLSRPEGRYVTVECDAPLTASREGYKPLIDEISDCIRSMTADCDTFLAVGVGNPLLTADALGSRAVSLLKVNRGVRAKGEKELSAFAPSVSGVTGIESFDVVKSVTDCVKPDCVIMIDSLASAAVSRLGTAFQISDSGLTPGSGVGGGKKAMSRQTLNVKRTVSVGVPLVVYAETIIRDAVGYDIPLEKSCRDLVVTPKDIDLLMGECAHIIAEAVNSALGL